LVSAKPELKTASSPGRHQYLEERWRKISGRQSLNKCLLRLRQHDAYGMITSSTQLSLPQKPTARGVPVNQSIHSPINPNRPIECRRSL
jgi:hypothetical protein